MVERQHAEDREQHREQHRQLEGHQHEGGRGDERAVTDIDRVIEIGVDLHPIAEHRPKIPPASVSSGTRRSRKPSASSDAVHGEGRISVDIAIACIARLHAWTQPLGFGDLVQQLLYTLTRGIGPRIAGLLSFLRRGGFLDLEKRT